MSRNLAFIVCVLLSAASICDAQQMTVSPDRATGIYDVGEAVRWRVEWKGDGPVPSATRYVLKSGGLKDAGQGELKFEGNVATVESKFDAPNTILLEVQWGPTDKPTRAFGGAVASPEKITPAAAEPDASRRVLEIETRGTRESAAESAGGSRRERQEWRRLLEGYARR